MTMLIEATTPAPLIAGGTRAGSRFAGALAIVLVGLYLLLHNPYWVRHGDSEVYLSLARNIAAGEGYRFNGQPVAIVPPAWPLMLAGAMKITTSLAVLKLLPTALTIGFLLLSYTLLLRWTTPLIAAMCVLMAAMLEPVFSLTYLFFSDSLFALVMMAAVWAALRVNDGKESWGWIVLLVVLCVLGVSVRWAGLPFFACVGAAVLHGELLPRWNRRWIAFGVSAVATAVTFVLLRMLLSVDQSQLDPRYDNFVAGAYRMVSERGLDDSYLNRIAHFGEWIGGLLWRPMQTYRFSRLFDNAAGWIVSLLLLTVVVQAAKRREWIWLGGATYLVVLGVNWPDPISRYIIPLAPFILLGTYVAITDVMSQLSREGVRLIVLNTFFASILAVNGGLYLMNFTVLRSRSFYEAWQGGMHKQLIDAAVYLRKQEWGPYEIAISGRVVNFGRVFPETDGYRRAINFLSGRDIVTVPIELCREPDARLVRWLTERNVRYYLYQPPIQVVEHFSPRTLDGDAIDPDQGAWRLYEIKEGKAIRVPLIPIGDWPREVPSL